MRYTSNTETIFLSKNIGGAKVYYRLFHSTSERGGYFLLLSSSLDDGVDDVFIPFVAESGEKAARILNFLYDNDVSPLTAPEILDEFLGSE